MDRAHAIVKAIVERLDDLSAWDDMAAGGERANTAEQLRDTVNGVLRATMPDGLTFGDALTALKGGKKVARKDWNGRGMWLCLQDGGTYHGSHFTDNAQVRRHAFGQPKNEITVLPCIAMKTADEAIVYGWLASQSDVLAEDWYVVTP